MNLLLIEDSPTDAYIVREALNRVPGERFRVHHVERIGEAIRCIEHEPFDVVLLDLGLPDSEGTEGVCKLHTLYPQLPLVVLTGTDDEAIAMNALHCGADDYLVKGEADPKVLARMLRYAVERRQLAVERLGLEARLHEAQRRESLIALAGGVAHHFNNLLAIILGYSEGLLATEDLAESQRHDIQQIELAARRAATISQQMATFTGSGFYRMAPLDLRALIMEATPVLRGVAGAAVRLTLETEVSVPPILGTAQALSQLLENLVRNAAESIPEAGEVGIRVDAVDLEAGDLEALAKGEALSPGHYVRIAVQDTGEGMSPETRSRMFDPFFSSKFTGRGMGLAVALGIVTMHRGGIGVESAPGAGTTVRVYLPAADAD
jgi:signal transduction histidine kinase